MKRPVNKRYDLAGNGLLRVVKLSAIARFVPVGNLRGGPGIRCLAVLGILHYFGGILYCILAKYGHKIIFLKRMVNKI